MNQNLSVGFWQRQGRSILLHYIKMINVISSFTPLFRPIYSTLNVCLAASHNGANCYVKRAINLVVTFPSVLPDKYKPDPSDAAGARSEQLSDSDGWPAH